MSDTLANPASPPCPKCGTPMAMSPTMGLWCWGENRTRLREAGQSVEGCPTEPGECPPNALQTGDAP